MKTFYCILVVMIVGLGVLWSEVPERKFQVYFLDVGQGDATLVVSPQGHRILIDGGDGNLVIERLGEVLPYFGRGLDMVVMTHPHADHVNGLVEVLKRFDVEAVLIGGMLGHEQGYLEFLREVDEVYIAEAGVDFWFGDVLIDVIYPVESFYGKSFANINNASVVVVVEYKGQRILLTGDAEHEEEAELIGLVGDVDVYQAGHHGSKTASGIEFLAEIQPEVVVISCGEDNSFGHPHEEAMENFELAGVREIRRTDLEGTIEFEFAVSTLRVPEN